MSGLSITKPSNTLIASPALPPSKSIANRLIILQQLIGANKLNIQSIGTADDSVLLLQALQQTQQPINLQHAGTCLRFLTAYFAQCPNKQVVLTGSSRLKQRPIKPLVDALKQLGADIMYLEEEGFAPIKITGQPLQGGAVTLDSSTSSQFLTALMLIGAFLPKGLTIQITTNVVSASYVALTVEVLKQVGIMVEQKNNGITVKPYIPQPSNQNHKVETDWSAAAFWFVMAALSSQPKVNFKNLNLATQQGDVFIANALSHAITTDVVNGDIVLTKAQISTNIPTEINVINSPDLVPALVVYYCAINQPVKIIGAQTLELKESKRLTALTTQLNQNGFKVNHNQTQIWVEESVRLDYQKTLSFKVYNDHRLAMAFACLAMRFEAVVVDDATVVSKSYPGFWNDLKQAGFSVVKK